MQTADVRWKSNYSNEFRIRNGVWQGIVLSDLDNILWCLGTRCFCPKSPAEFLLKICMFYQILKTSGDNNFQINWILGYFLLCSDEMNSNRTNSINISNISSKSPANMEITWGHCPHVPKESGGLPQGTDMRDALLGLELMILHYYSENEIISISNNFLFVCSCSRFVNRSRTN